MGFLSDLSSGLKAYWRGVNWLLNHKLLLILLFLPMVLGITLFLTGSSFLFSSADELFLLLFTWTRPEVWWQVPFYWLVKAIFYISMFVFTLVVAMMFIAIISAPLYEYVSSVVEEEISGRKAPSMSLLSSLRLIIEESKKALFILGISFVLLIIPLFNILGLLITAFLIGWDVFDYAPSRHGFSFAKRRGIAKRNFWKISGLGLWLCIPGLQFFLLPMAIVGGTMLSIDSLE